MKSYKLIFELIKHPFSNVKLIMDYDLTHIRHNKYGGYLLESIYNGDVEKEIKHGGITMTTEEKARAYDKALENAKEWAKNPTVWSSDDICQKLFPELVESESEKIRDCIGMCLTDANEQRFKDYNTSLKECLDWLGIQDNQNPTEVKPKFKVGYWIITDKNHIWYVDEDSSSTGYLYRLVGINGKVEVAECEIVEKHSHLWTIQDARNGDVLEFDCGIGLFKAQGDELDSAYCHCYLNTDGTLEIDGSFPYDTYQVRPATKEQRDLLFAKMKEAGYKWDNEKNGIVAIT